jgi:hypothetical protein
MTRLASRFLLLVLISAAAGCSRPDAASEEAADGVSVPVDPEARMAWLEERLTTADTVLVDFHITSSGAFTADIAGRFSMGPSGHTAIVADGTFGGRPVDLALLADGQEMTFANGENSTTAAHPDALREAILIGLTRMGILHNLARFTTVAPPDHGAGGVRDWVVTGPYRADSTGLGFDITVAGQPAGGASLEMDDEGRPVVRYQRVAFPSGEMLVTERYSNVYISP